MVPCSDFCMRQGEKDVTLSGSTWFMGHAASSSSSKSKRWSCHGQNCVNFMISAGIENESVIETSRDFWPLQRICCKTAKPCKTHKNYSQPSSSQAICKRKQENTAVSCEKSWVFSLARRMNFLAFIQSLFQVQFDGCAHNVRIWIVSLVTFFGLKMWSPIPHSIIPLSKLM